jgi:hypothetical protein
MAAMKLVLDRIVPASTFDTAKGNNGSGAPIISINISGLASSVVQTEEVVYDITDVEAKGVDNE